MILSFHPCFDADEQILLGDRFPGPLHLERIKEAQAIILPQGVREEVYALCVQNCPRVFPDYKARFQYPGKIGQCRLFEALGINQPRTHPWAHIAAFQESSAQRSEHGFPFLIKCDRRHEGDGVYWVPDQDDLERALEKLAIMESSGEYGFVTQEYVPCGGNVLRAVILDKKIITYWKRPHAPGQVVTTLSRGASIDFNWRPDLQDKGKAQVRNISRKAGINLGAIDFVFPMAGDPAPLTLEINYFFGRRGLGGTETYYGMLLEAVVDWLTRQGLDAQSVRLV